MNSLIKYSFLLTLLVFLVPLITSCQHNEVSELISNMNDPRANHYSILLKNGNVLVLGGKDYGSDSIELFEYDKKKFKKIYEAPDTRDAEPIEIEDGRVFIRAGKVPLIYDPDSDTISKLDQIPIEVSSAVMLQDKTILVTDGDKAGIFDPKTNNFSFVGNTVQKRDFGKLNLLSNGDVIFEGGVTKQNKSLPYYQGTSPVYDELFNAKTKTFTLFKDIPKNYQVIYDKPIFKAIILLDDGSNLDILNNKLYRSWNVKNTPSDYEKKLDIYLPNLYKINNRKILIVGGQDDRMEADFNATNTMYLFYTKDNSIIQLPDMISNRQDPGIVKLADDKILITGGTTKSLLTRKEKLLNTAEIYTVIEHNKK